MTKTEIKHTAQDELLYAAQIAFYSIHESGKYSDEDAEIIAREASKQLERIEALFGYERGSWKRC